MKKQAYRTIFLFAVLLHSVVATSDNLRTYALTNSRTPSRIISLKPNITEILFALGVGDNVVGVTTWCDRPNEAKALPKVADYININTEKIMALKPDLVIGSEENSIKEQFAVLKNAGFRTMTAPFRTFDEFYSSIEKIADAAGVHQKGKELVANIRSANLRTHALTHSRTVLILVGHRPLVAAGPLTFYGEIIGMIGAKNIIETKRTPYPVINTEFILAKRPDIIIDMGMGSEASTDLPSGLEQKVVKFDLSELRAGPRIGEGIRELNEALDL